MQMQYVQFNCAQTLIKIQMLNNTQKAVFFTFWSLIGATQKALPREKKDLLKILKTNRVRIKNFNTEVANVLNQFFDFHEDGWHHQDLDKQIQGHNKI
jgi:uncharacterized protein YdaU (DUF1376 family)